MFAIGFVDDDSEVNHSEERSQNQSPDPEKAAFDDPELYEIHKKLKELEADVSDISEGDLSKAGDFACCFRSVDACYVDNLLHA